MGLYSILNCRRLHKEQAMQEKPLSKLIIADDDDDILTIMRFALEDMNDVTIKYCHSGQETIKEALLLQPDMIILDVMMPHMDGITTFEMIRKIPSLEHIPCVFLTARVHGHEIERYRKLGAAEVIIKPFDALALPKTILDIWNRHQLSA